VRGDVAGREALTPPAVVIASHAAAGHDRLQEDGALLYGIACCLHVQNRVCPAEASHRRLTLARDGPAHDATTNTSIHAAVTHPHETMPL
jgi:hypothetical protein